MGDAIRIDDATKKRLLDYILEEGKLADKDTFEPIQKKRESWNNTYYGEVEARRAKWMSNFPVQMGATFVDSITARLMNTSFAYRPFWTARPMKGNDWTPVVKSVEQFLDYKVQVEMRLYREMRKAMFETVRLGTGAMLTPWVRETRVRMKKGFLGIKTQVEDVVRNGVVCEAIPMKDLRFPGGFSELEKMPWWGRTLCWTKEMAREQKFLKLYDVSDKLLKTEEQQLEADETAQQRAGEEPFSVKRINLREYWLRFDLGTKGEYKRYVLTVHPESREILRLEEDTYSEWPLTLFRYGPRDYGINGLGVIEMTQAYDKALESLYNLLVDNFKISTLQAFKGRKGSGLRPDTDVYPGKLFLLNDPEKDLIPFPMGVPFNLNPAFVRSIWELGERRSGVSDYALGRESPVAAGRATATGTLALIQEGARRFDLTIRDIRDALDDLGMFNVREMHERLDPQEPYMVLGDKGKYVQQFLNLPETPPYMSLAMISSVSHVAMNKEVEKQDHVTTMQMLSAYYTQALQMLGQAMLPATQPALRETLLNIAKASADKMNKVLTTYGEMSPELYTEVFGPMIGGANVNGIQSAGPNGVPGQPGMAPPPGATPGAEGGGISEPSNMPLGAGAPDSGGAIMPSGFPGESTNPNERL